MIAKRITIIAAVCVAASGCGVTATVLGAVPRSAATGGGAAAVATAIPGAGAQQPAAAAIAAPTATPAPLPPPQVIVTAAESSTSGATFEVTLVSTAGVVLASAAVPADARWSVGAGAGAAYWVTGGRLQRLTTSGPVATLGTVPTTESGRVLVSPDGSAWAYATTSTSASGVVTNRLYSGGVEQTTRLIAQRMADPAHPSADAPSQWQYYPLSWTARGILIERQPLGGCGCGTPFDMEMTAAFSAYIDPVTGAATPLTGSSTCPLSGVSADGTGACFERSSTGGSIGIRFVNTLRTTARYAMSGQNDGGAAVFNGGTVVYATVPSTAGGCGGADWRPLTSLHVMDVATGNARTVGRLGLAPVAWLDNGSILGTLSRAASGGATTSTVVSIDPGSGAVTTILGRTTDVVGIA